MQTSKRLKIYCALLFVMTIMVSTIASVGTSYAHFVYTGEHQVVLHKAEETGIESNIMFPQGCTVVLKEWNMNSSCEAQTISAFFSGKEGKGKISCSIPQEYAKYYTVGIADAEGVSITENDEVLVTAEGTELIITVTPVTEKLNTLAAAISAEVLLTLTELTETTAEDGAATVSEGDKMTGTLKWNIIPLDEPLPEYPPIPTATVTEIANEELIFALNFKADEVTEEQLNYYGSWYADFELKVNKDVTFNADGSADGWLSGQYDAWSENWVNVPFENVTLAASTPLKIMEYVAELMGQAGFKYTYAEVYEGVKEFNCGVFFDEEFLAANPDLEVTLEFRMYNPANENESYVIGETYTFTLENPAIPTATATEIVNEELTFAMNFKADEVTAWQLDYYGSWYTDFEITLNKDITFHGNGSEDGWLSGQLDAWSENWVKMPLTAITIPAGQSFRIMEYASEILGKPNYRYTYAEVYEGIKDFDCGVFFSNEYLLANPDIEVTLELRMYNPADESESYVIGETYTFTYEVPSAPTATATEIVNEELTFAMNFKAAEATAEQLDYYGSWHTDFEITLNKDITFHGNGSEDGWLSGQLDAWSENWVKIPLTAIEVPAGESFGIMEYAAIVKDNVSRKYTYAEVYEGIKDFDCGVFFSDAYLAANPDLEVKLELRMYNPVNENESYVIGGTHIFKAADLDTSIEEQEPQQTAEPTTVCTICSSSEHTTENHPAEETVVCIDCGATDHTAENCVTEVSTVETETSENDENSIISEADVTEEIETVAYDAAYSVAGVQLNAETAGLKTMPMLFTFMPVLTTVNEIPEVSPTLLTEINSVETSTKAANASNVSIIHGTDIITYTYITYPEGTKTVEITDFENVVVDEGTRYVYSFTPYTQVHTEEMIYVLPYGNSFTIETDPLTADTLSFKIVSKDAYVQAEETETTEEETEPSTEAEEIIFTSKAVKWKFNDGTNMFQTSENICYSVEGSDFDNNAPLAEILSAEGPVVVKIMPETDGKTVYSIEYYSNGTYTAADLEDFSTEIDKQTNIMKINVGEHYPQAGIYRVCLQLQQGNKLSAYYKTFFVNYR